MTRLGSSRLTIVGEREASLGGQAIRYLVKRSPRARYARLEVKPDAGLIVVIPRRYSLEHVPALLERKSRWVLEKLADQTQVEQLRRRPFRSGDTIPYLGRDMEVVMASIDGEVDSARMLNGRLVLRSGSPNGHLWLLIEQWYRQQADVVIRERADVFCSQLGVSYGRLTIRRARTRWGSCSCKGNLNFNWGLVMMPEPVMDYVIIHELTHLREMNHAIRFWELVAQHCPRWREHKRWIREHEALLTARMSGLKG